MIPLTETKSIAQPSGGMTVESGDTAGRISHNLVINPTIFSSMGSKAKDKILVYRTIPPLVNKERTLTLAKKFNLTGNLRGNATVQSDDLRFALYTSSTSGSIEYQDFARPNDQLDLPEYLPSDDEAIKIATKFLKDRDLYPEDAAGTVVYRENVYGGSDQRIYYGQIGVWYLRSLNGLKVKGTQLVVYVAGNGDVIGYFSNWRDYKPYKELAVTSPDLAFEKLKAVGVPVGMYPNGSEISVDQVYLAYQTTPAAYSENYISPVWVFKGSVMADGKPVMPFEQFVPALTEESKTALTSL